MGSLLQVLCGHADDARRAEEGGADRIHLVADPRAGESSPPTQLVAEVCTATALPVRVTLRLREDWTTDGGEVARVRGLAAAYRDAGAEGMVMGFLDQWSAVDVEVCATIADGAGWPWTFDRAVDYCLDFDHAWLAPEQILHTPEAPTGKNSRLGAWCAGDLSGVVDPTGHDAFSSAVSVMSKSERYSPYPWASSSATGMKRSAAEFMQ